jgi:hypothetical protein
MELGNAEIEAGEREGCFGRQVWLFGVGKYYKSLRLKIVVSALESKKLIRKLRSKCGYQK